MRNAVLFHNAQMEQRGIVGPFEGSKPREVRITKQQWFEMTMRNGSLDAPTQNDGVPDEISGFEEE